MIGDLMTTARFPIRYNPAARFLLGAVFIRPHGSFVEVSEREVCVRMGWGFRARFARSSVTRCSEGIEGTMLGLGIHGFGGRWLVNGSLDGLVSLHLSPPQRAYVLGVPVKLRELQVSLVEPEALLTCLHAAPA
jgi:hypothetical protein